MTALALTQYCSMNSPWALFRGTNSASEVGRHSREVAIDIIDHYYIPSSQQTEDLKIYDEILAAFCDADESDWDGYGAEPLSVEAISNALNFYNDYLGDLPFPEILPEQDGDLSFSWQGEEGAVFSLSFNESRLFNFAGVFNDGTKIHGVENIDTVDKKMLERNIFKATSAGTYPR